MKKFYLYRDSKYIAEGIEFTDGVVVIRWLVGNKSTAEYNNMATMYDINGDGGKTMICNITCKDCFAVVN